MLTRVLQVVGGISACADGDVEKRAGECKGGHEDVAELERQAGEEQQQEEEEEEEEHVELPESELIHLLDAQENPLLVCRRLFLHAQLSSLLLPQPTLDLEVLAPAHIHQLHKCGILVLDDVFDAQTVIQAREDTLRTLLPGGRLVKPSSTRDADDPFRDEDARADVIAWMSPEDGISAALAAIMHRLAVVQRDLSKVVHLHGEVEYQLAVYESNVGGYDKHRDGLPCDDPDDSTQRRVTLISYLNPLDWDCARDGGALEAYVPCFDELVEECDVVLNGPIHCRLMRIAPRGGLLVVFLSGAVDHAVLPSAKERVALTAWCR
jgi:hypothetical protein